MISFSTLMLRRIPYPLTTNLSTEENVQKGTQAVQVCNAATKEAQTVGIFAVDSVDDLKTAQEAVKSWAGGACIDIADGESSDVDLGVLASAATVTRRGGFSKKMLDGFGTLAARAECRPIQVVAGDSCGSLASRCGISGNDFTKFNPQENLCANLMPKQWVCCSEGDLPDMTPQPQPDGTCATHTIGSDDNCWAIGDNYGISTDRINEVNKGTWGWAGCDRLQAGQVICLSTGNTPMPATVEGVACGPQKPGTEKPEGEFDGWDLAELNQCPLKACCSGWGYCGTTTEFCVETPADTGAPGAFEPNTNGCISNCGTDVVNNDKTPAGFARVGYFQAYNPSRPCLRMDASEITDNWGHLTHVHFAFAGITSDFNVRIPDNVKDQFELFASTAYPFNKVLSFGGWAESTEPETYQLYRDAVKPGNRDTFANNIVNFLNDKGLHGADIDWEYPGATDQDGVPPSTEEDAQNYLEFLKVLRGLLGEGDKSLSIALPASYWYLKPFPVAEMGEVVDYFIYMTYDLHGQWGKFAVLSFTLRLFLAGMLWIPRRLDVQKEEKSRCVLLWC